MLENLLLQLAFYVNYEHLKTCLTRQACKPFMALKKANSTRMVILFGFRHFSAHRVILRRLLKLVWASFLLQHSYFLGLQNDPAYQII